MKTYTLTHAQVAAHDSGDDRQTDALMADLRQLAADLGETIEVSHPGGFMVGVFEAPIRWDEVGGSMAGANLDRFIETGGLFV